jgi:O-antigen ligase
MKINLNKTFLVLLPFTQALTVNILFPLKISELALLIIFLYLLNKKLISYSTIWFLNKNKLLLLFTIIVTASFIINIWWYYDYHPKKIPFRINRIGDSFIRLCYFYLCVCSFFLSFKIFVKDIKYLRYFVYGALIAVAYGWYIFLSSALKLPYFKLPGMEEEPQMLYGIVRCGTFKEGNYFGLFLVLSSSIAFYLKKTKTAFVLLISVVITMSTVSIISSVFLLLFYYRNKFLNLKFIIIIIPITIVLFFIISKTDFYKISIYGKLFDSVKTVTNKNYSKIERTVTASAAYYMGFSNPFLGVGPSNYGVHYDHFNYFKKIVRQRDYYLDKRMLRKNERAIPNNVYLEVWSEYGVLGFIVFIIFLFSILIISFKLKEDSITAGIISLIISLNAFPSFIMLFLWVFISIPFALEWNKRKDKYIAQR